MSQVLQQLLNPPLRVGEDATVTITATGLSATPAAWDVRFSMATWGAGAPDDPVLEVETPDVTVSVTGTSGNYTAVWSVPITAAQSAALEPGDGLWELARTDSGSQEVLAAGTWPVVRGVTAW